MKKRIYRFLEPSPQNENRWENSFDVFIIALILLSVGAVVLRTMKSLPEGYGSFLEDFQLFATGGFTIEYLLRIYSCTVLKLFRYSRSLRIFAWVLREKANQLTAAFFATGVLLIFSSSLVYFAERGAQAEAFPSIPATMWWGIITLTTVGYGDVSPMTPLGQLFGAVTAVVGIGIVALPSGILASGFIEEFAEEEEQTEEERDAGSPGEAGEKRCSHCGHPLQ